MDKPGSPYDRSGLQRPLTLLTTNRADNSFQILFSKQRAQLRAGTWQSHE